jgi:hypothetical protein
MPLATGQHEVVTNGLGALPLLRQCLLGTQVVGSPAFAPCNGSCTTPRIRVVAR